MIVTATYAISISLHAHRLNVGYARATLAIDKYSPVSSYSLIGVLDSMYIYSYSSSSTTYAFNVSAL